MSKMVFIDDIDLAGSPMVRDEIRMDVVEDYVHLYKESKNKLPPVVLFTPDNKQVFVADGMHRLRALTLLKQKVCIADLRKGTYEDALKFALTANEKHGLRRSPADKRCCVKQCLRQWPQLSDRAAAATCSVSSDLIVSVREELEHKGEIKPQPMREGLDGKQYPAEVEKPSKPKPESEKPAPDEKKAPAEKKAQRLTDKDSVGFIIPDYAMQFWSRTNEAKELIAPLSMLASFLKEAQRHEDLMYAEVNISAALADLDKLMTNMATAIPYAVCTQCQGQPKAQPGGSCRLCKGRGLISKFMWNRVPESVRRMREASK